MKQTFLRRLPLVFAAFVATAAIASCDDDNGTAPTATPTAVAPATEPAASATVASRIEGPSVVVTGAGGGPAQGVLVHFAVSGGGAIQYPVVETNAQGIASAGQWQIGPTVGANTVTATVEGLAPVTFTVTGTPGPAAQIIRLSGDVQVAEPGAGLPQPLTVRITDAGGNVIAGQTVTFAVATGGGAIAGASATTNAQGDASSGTWTLGADPCSFVQTVTATSGALVTTFSSTIRPSLAIPGSADGTLAATDCALGGRFTDEYGIATTNGQGVQISLTSAAFDAVLNVSTFGGTLVATDDNSGGGTNATLKVITAAGTQAVGVTSAAAGATGAYTVTTESVSAAVTTCGTTYIQIGASTAQTIGLSDCDAGGFAADEYLVYVTAGTRIRVAQQSPIDAYLFVYRPSGVLQAEVDDGFLNFTEATTFTATETGFYRILASSWGIVNDDFDATLDAGPYTLSVTIP